MSKSAGDFILEHINDHSQIHGGFPKTVVVSEGLWVAFVPPQHQQLSQVKLTEEITVIPNFRLEGWTVITREAA